LLDAGTGTQRALGSARVLMSATEVLWELLVFLALVAGGLIVLSLLARTH
jgi:hypothetical protein